MKRNAPPLSHVISSVEVVERSTRGALRNPVVVIVLLMIVGYGSYKNTPVMYGPGFNLFTVAFIVSWLSMQYGLCYLYLGRVKHYTIVRNIPFYWTLCVIFFFVILAECVLGYFYTFVDKSLPEIVSYFVSVFLLTAMGIFFALAINDRRIRNAISNDPSLVPIWWPSKLYSDPLLSELPQHVRGTILRLHAHNQYVEVITDKGKYLIRSTLKSAMERLNPKAGIQAHRSLWIRSDQIIKFCYVRGNPKIVDVTKNSFPISRNKIDEVKSLLAEKSSA